MAGRVGRKKGSIPWNKGIPQNGEYIWEETQ